MGCGSSITRKGGKKVAKGLKMVLEERGMSTVGKSADWMRKSLGEHSDFKNEKSMVERMLVEKGHIPCFLPKFHPELKPIERVWAQLK
jgi:transposase